MDSSYYNLNIIIAHAAASSDHADSHCDRMFLCLYYDLLLFWLLLLFMQAKRWDYVCRYDDWTLLYSINFSCSVYYYCSRRQQGQQSQTTRTVRPYSFLFTLFLWPVYHYCSCRLRGQTMPTGRPIVLFTVRTMDSSWSVYRVATLSQKQNSLISHRIFFEQILLFPDQRADNWIDLSWSCSR